MSNTAQIRSPDKHMCVFSSRQSLPNHDVFADSCRILRSIITFTRVLRLETGPIARSHCTTIAASPIELEDRLGAVDSTDCNSRDQQRQVPRAKIMQAVSALETGCNGARPSVPSSEPCTIGRPLQLPRGSRTGWTHKRPCRGWFANCRMNKPRIGPIHKHETLCRLCAFALHRSRRTL